MSISYLFYFRLQHIIYSATILRYLSISSLLKKIPLTSRYISYFWNWTSKFCIRWNQWSCSPVKQSSESEVQTPYPAYDQPHPKPSMSLSADLYDDLPTYLSNGQVLLWQPQPLRTPAHVITKESISKVNKMLQANELTSQLAESNTDLSVDHEFVAL